MAYTPTSVPPIRIKVAHEVIVALGNQPGTDVLPASLSRFMTAVCRKTGYRFSLIGHGRHRDVMSISRPEVPEGYGLVLKVGNKQSNMREIKLTLLHPDDWAKIYDAFDYGLVAEQVDMIRNLDDPRIKTPEFKARFEDLGTRYVGLTTQDLGFTEDGRIVIVGSSARVLKVDAVVKGSASQQIRAV
jgi:hypothetical protein